MKTDFKQILIVADHPSQRRLLRKLLSKLCCREVSILEAANGDQAVFLSKHWHPQVIFIDLKLPGMGGFEAIQRIRELAAADLVVQYQPWIIATVASAFQEECDRTIPAGCDSVMGKPYTPDDVLHRLPQDYQASRKEVVYHRFSLSA